MDTGLDASVIRSLLERQTKRIRRDLGLRSSPFSFEEDAVSASGVAGIVQIAPNVEVEIVPKCFASNNPYWREDFLFMATVTKAGRIFRRQRVSATPRANSGDLLSLLAEIFLNEMEQLIRVPIRQYRQFSWTDLEIDGELEYSEFWDPHPDGFTQTGSRLSSENLFMSTIFDAAAYLGASSEDRGVGLRLQRLCSNFRRPITGRGNSRVPGRHARWQELYDLALDVLAGHGTQLKPAGLLRAPGFLLNTERCWEDILGLALMAQSNLLRAEITPRRLLGKRITPHKIEDIYATPDITVDSPSLPAQIVVDAKYKGSGPGKPMTMDRPDVYEALGFMQAANCSVAILVYPDSNSDSASETGSATEFERIEIDQRQVVGVAVDTRGIGRVRGLFKFGQRFGANLLDIAAKDSTSVRTSVGWNEEP